ncbi:hypothetical protein FHS45_001712 [Thalassobacillus devorans]|nr:hypothetical protein [Thalassobacillus devorans]
MLDTIYFNLKLFSTIKNRLKLHNIPIIGCIGKKHILLIDMLTQSFRFIIRV